MINFFTTISKQKKPTLLPGLTTIDGTANDLDDIPIKYNLYDTQLVYANNKYYHATLEQHFSHTCDKMIIEYDLDANETIKLMGDPLDQPNYHQSAAAMVDYSGRVYLFYVRHGLSIEIFKADNIDDISAFTKLAETITGGGVGAPEYINILKNTNDNTFHIVSKAGTDEVVFYNASAGLEGWGPANILTIPGTETGVTQVWNFFLSMDNQDAGGWNHVSVQQRNDGIYYDLWHLKTQDWITFYNNAETQIKDVITSGGFTQAELKANFAVRAGINDGTPKATINASTLSTFDDQPYWILEGASREFFDYWDGSAFVEKELNLRAKIADYFRTVQIQHLGGFKFRIFILVDDSILGNYRLDMYITNDLFDNITLEETIIEESNGTFLAKMPFNYWEIPKGANFPLVCSSCKDQAISPTSNTRNNDIQIRLFRK